MLLILNDMHHKSKYQVCRETKCYIRTNMVIVSKYPLDPWGRKSRAHQISRFMWTHEKPLPSLLTLCRMEVDLPHSSRTWSDSGRKRWREGEHCIVPPFSLINAVLARYRCSLWSSVLPSRMVHQVGEDVGKSHYVRRVLLKFQDISRSVSSRAVADLIVHSSWFKETERDSSRY